MQHLVRPLTDGGDQLIDVVLGVMRMDDNANTALPLWHDRIGKVVRHDIGKHIMEEQILLVARPSSNGYNVRMELALLPPFSNRARQQARRHGLLPIRFTRKPFEQVRDCLLNPLLLLQAHHAC